MANHDHVFIDSDNKYLQSLVSMARENYGKYTTISTSHWPEEIRSGKCGYIQLDEMTPRKLNSNYTIEKQHLFYNDINIISLNIMTTELLKEWFLNGDWGDIELFRTDGVVTMNSPSIKHIKDSLGIPLPLQDIVIPYKEQFRHFDGYMHQRIDNNTCVPLSIPNGFFESNIKIRYGYDDYKDGWVNINPKNPNYYAADLNGVDYKITIDDIPLVWKNRISEMDINSNIDDEEMIQYRLKDILSMVYSDDRYNSYIDSDVEVKVLNTHLNNYKQYELEH